MSQAGQSRTREGSAPLPRVTAIETVLPQYHYTQDEIADAIARPTLGESAVGSVLLKKIQANAGVSARHLSLPLEELTALDDFTEANRMWLDTALDVGERVLTEALRTAGLRPEDVDAVISTTVTGLAVPSLEARLVHRVGMRPDVKRIPLFGNGCAGGAVGLARLHEYLRAYPDQVAVLLAVELCSLAYQYKDTTMANVVASSLFGDGAAAVVAVGGNRAGAGDGDRVGAVGSPELVDTYSWLLPDTEGVLGWDIGAHGFRIRLGPELPALTEEHLPTAVRGLLARHELTPDRIAGWICHSGGPKVLTAVERSLDLPPQALALTRQSMADRGNLSSVSVLDVLRMAGESPPPSGALGLVAALGPGFAVELVLIRW